MQQTQVQNVLDPHLSTNSHSSLSATTNTLLNGHLRSHLFSPRSMNAPLLAVNLTPNQSPTCRKHNSQLERSQRIKSVIVVVILTFLLAFFLIITMELAVKLVKIKSARDQSKYSRQHSNVTAMYNETILEEQNQYRTQTFFIYVWTFNCLLLINCAIVHSIATRRYSRHGQTKAIFFK